MATIVTRSGKGSPLTIAEMDTNLTNLNTLKLEITSSTGAAQLPVGDTASRPTASDGMIRYNSELDQFEGYTTAGGWAEIAGGLSEATADTVILGNVNGAGQVYQELTEDTIKSNFGFRSVYTQSTQPAGWVIGDFWIKTAE